jgi:DNA-binding transcriptional regulator YiaG
MNPVRNMHYCGREDSMAAKEMNKIRKMRKDAGMTQKMFSDFFGIPVRTLQDWENGMRNPPDYLIRLLPYKLMLEWDYDNKRPKELKKS